MSEPTCPECGEPLGEKKLQALCLACVGRRVHRELLEREREAWTLTPPEMVATSLQRGRVRHIVLAVDSGRTYCGQEATEPTKKRLRVLPEKVPDSVCADCREKFDHIQRLAAEVRSGKGVAK